MTPAALHGFSDELTKTATVNPIKAIYQMMKDRQFKKALQRGYAGKGGVAKARAKAVK